MLSTLNILCTVNKNATFKMLCEYMSLSIFVLLSYEHSRKYSIISIIRSLVNFFNVHTVHGVCYFIFKFIWCKVCICLVNQFMVCSFNVNDVALITGVCWKENIEYMQRWYSSFCKMGSICQKCILTLTGSVPTHCVMKLTGTERSVTGFSNSKLRRL